MINPKIKIVVKGKGSGKVLKSDSPISFLGGIDPKTGLISDEAHPLFGENVREKVLAIPSSKGSTVGSYVLYSMRKADTAPSAILCKEFDMITATGCVLAKIPLLILDEGTWKSIDNGQFLDVDAYTGTICEPTGR